MNAYMTLYYITCNLISKIVKCYNIIKMHFKMMKK